MNPHQRNATVTAMFIWTGVADWDAENGSAAKGMADVLNAWGDQGGCLELAMAIAEWGEVSESMLDARGPDQDFPGVYDYEVSESFGHWIGAYIVAHKEFPDADEARAKLKALADEFFSEGSK